MRREYIEGLKEDERVSREEVIAAAKCKEEEEQKLEYITNQKENTKA